MVEKIVYLFKHHFDNRIKREALITFKTNTNRKLEFDKLDISTLPNNNSLDMVDLEFLVMCNNKISEICGKTIIIE